MVLAIVEMVEVAPREEARGRRGEAPLIPTRFQHALGPTVHLDHAFTHDILSQITPHPANLRMTEALPSRPLFRLPRELRDIIYAYAISRPPHALLQPPRTRWVYLPKIQALHN
jgi:hypothetical protein